MRLVFAALAVIGLAACSAPQGLAPGLTARMDTAGAQLNKAEAINIINQYRATRGAAPLTLNASLDANADSLASQYASSSNRPSKPASASAIRFSAGYANFADTFSGWRGSAADANDLADPAHKTAGIGVAYSPTSAYGIYWVLLMDDGAQMAMAQ